MVIVDVQIDDRIVNYNKYKDVYSGRTVKPLIENYKKDNLQSASYDITMTNMIRKFKDEFKTIELNVKDSVDNAFEEISISCGYNLRSKEYIIVQINEIVNMPDDLTAHIRPRTTFTKLGLILSCQHINPSYNGQLQLGLYNATPYVVKLTPNLKIGQIVFEKLDGEADKNNLYYRKAEAKYQNEKGFVGSKIYDEVEKKAQQEYEKIINSISNKGV